MPTLYYIAANEAKHKESIVAAKQYGNKPVVPQQHNISPTTR